MFESIIKGKVFKVGNDIDTDQIFPGRYLYLTSPEEMAVHAMEDAIPDFYKKIKGKNWIIAAGKNFGCGSSREQAPRAILFAGIKAVVAESFGRIFYRNAINVGLSVIKYPNTFKEINQSDSIKIDFQNGILTLYNPDRKIPIEKYPAQLLSILKSGGLIPYLKKYRKYSHFIDKLY